MVIEKIINNHIINLRAPTRKAERKRLNGRLNSHINSTKTDEEEAKETFNELPLEIQTYILEHPLRTNAEAKPNKRIKEEARYMKEKKLVNLMNRYARKGYDGRTMELNLRIYISRMLGMYKIVEKTEEKEDDS